MSGRYLTVALCKRVPASIIDKLDRDTLYRSDYVFDLEVGVVLKDRSGSFSKAHFDWHGITLRGLVSSSRVMIMNLI